jgi:hypothetical protein
MKRFLVVFGMVAALVGFTAVSQAGATAELELISGGSFTTIPVTSSVTSFSQSFAGYSIGGTTMSLGSASLPIMDLSIAGGGTGAITVMFSESGFTYSGGLTFSASNTPIVGNPTLTAAVYWGPSLLSTANQIGSSLTLTGGLSSTSGNVNSTSAYSITEVFNVDPGAGSTVAFSADAAVTAPEPATLFLVSSGLAAGGLFGRFRKKKA